MKRRHAAMTGAAVLLAVAVMVGLAQDDTPPNGPAVYQVEPDPANVVANRLAGTWIADAGLTGRLTGVATRADAADARLTFTSDPDALDAIPEKFVRLLADRRIYLAGWMKMPDAPRQAYLLTGEHGVPTVLYFHEADDQPGPAMGSFPVMLAPGVEPANDLFFLGGSSPRESFIAFRRGVHAPPPTSQPDELSAAANPGQ